MSMYDRDMTTKTSALSAALTKAIASKKRVDGQDVVARTFDAIGDPELVATLTAALLDKSISPERAVDILDEMGVEFVCSPATLRRWVTRKRRFAGRGQEGASA